MSVTLASLLDVAEAIVKERLARLIVSEKTIGQVVKRYDDQLTNAVYDVFNGNSDPVDFRRAHKALIREFAPQAVEEGAHEGGITELDDDDRAALAEIASDWTSEQIGYVNDFATAIAEARKDKDQRPAILDRVSMWVDSMRSLGERGRAYAMSNVKATWQLGDRQTHTPDCVALSKRPAHRVSWWTERGYQPPIHLGCGCALVDAKSGETIMGEYKERREDRGGGSGGFVSAQQRKWFFASGHGSGSGGGGGGASAGPSKVKRSRLERDESEFRHYAENDDAEVHGAFQPEYRAWSNSLSASEKDAIKAYTNGGYDDMNKMLRNVGINPADPPPTTAKKRMLELDKAIAKAPKLNEDTILYRGFGSSELHAAVKNGKLKKGSTLTDKGYMSTSPQSLEARSFGLSKDDPVIYKIRAEKGTHGAYLGFDHINAGHSNEAEFLLPRNAKLVVVNAEMKAHGGARYAEIELAYLAD